MRVALALAFLLLPPAAAGAAVCERKPPPPELSAQERMLRETIRMRKQLGLPHGRAYVRRVNRDPAARRRAVEGYFPVTRREAAYLRARDDLTLSRGYTQLHRYSKRHRAASASRRSRTTGRRARTCRSA